MSAVPAAAGAIAQPACEPDPALPDDWAALLAAEGQAIAARRRKVLGDAASGNRKELSLPRIGLALSGGGVRSATFALGLMRGLAQSHGPDAAEVDPARRTLTSEGLLGRLDYLSTVSGGGYVGAMYGRLVATYGLHHAQALMARSRSSVLGWLRRNGRYLTPAGSRDTGIAVVTYLRAWLAIHTEFMFASILLGLLALITAWLVVMQWFVFGPETFAAFRSVPAWIRAGLLLLVWATWIGLTAGNAQMANTSSLHSFYRARLTQAYLVARTAAIAAGPARPGVIELWLPPVDKSASDARDNR